MVSEEENERIRCALLGSAFRDALFRVGLIIQQPMDDRGSLGPAVATASDLLNRLEDCGLSRNGFLAGEFVGLQRSLMTSPETANLRYWEFIEKLRERQRAAVRGEAEL